MKKIIWLLTALFILVAGMPIIAAFEPAIDIMIYRTDAALV